MCNCTSGNLSRFRVRIFDAPWNDKLTHPTSPHFTGALPEKTCATSPRR